MPALQLPRDIGQKHDTDRNADDGERQLVDPVRVVELRYGSRLQRRDDGSDGDIELRHAAGNNPRHAELHEMANIVRHPRALDAEAQTGPPHAPHQESELQEPGDEHSPGLDDAGFGPGPVAEPEREQRRDHHHAVEHDRDGRAFDKSPDRIERARHQRHDRHAQEVRHRDARQQHRQVELLRHDIEARRQPVHQKRHRHFGDDRHDQQDEQEAGHRVLGEAAGRLAPFALELFGKNRHERRIEGTLAEEPAEQIREAERDDERVGHPARSKRGGDQDVAQKAEDAA